MVSAVPGRARCLLFALSVFCTLPVGIAAALDLDGDGNLDANDLFVFSSHWMTDSSLADLVVDGTVDDHDLLAFIHEFRDRDLIPTPTPTGPLPPPVWTHPAFEDMGNTFYTYDGQEDDFLDWSDVPGAAAYEVIADITAQTSATPIHKTWFVERTRTPGVPVSNSKIEHLSHYTELVVVRVRALNHDPTPQPGFASDVRSFYVSLQNPPTITPTPTIKPTADINFNGDESTDKLDMLYLQKSWLTRLGQHLHYDPAVANLAEPTTEVDIADVIAFAREYERQRVPLASPVLVSPASGDIVFWTDFVWYGITYDWEPVPDTYGGVKYLFELEGPIDNDPYTETRQTKISNIEESEYTRGFPYHFPLPQPLSEYRWRVTAFSKYGIKIPSEPAPWNYFYVEQM
jgi:hypothetical protein